jgi:hypothetical protein
MRGERYVLPVRKASRFHRHDKSAGSNAASGNAVLAFARAAEIVVLKHHHLAIEFRFLANLILETEPLIERIHVETANAVDNKVRNHQALVAFAKKNFAKFGRNAESAFTVESVFEATAEHTLSQQSNLMGKFPTLSHLCATYSPTNFNCQ